MITKKFVVVGGGISGLSVARFLDTADCVVLEKDAELGGYCRTHINGDYTWDYAGHFFHFKTSEFEKMFMSEIPENERVFNKKNTKIRFGDLLVDYPFQTHIHQLEKPDLIKCITGLFLENEVCGEGFLSVLYKNYGSGIVDLFLKPYNEKLYACNLDSLDKDAMGRFFPAADKTQILQAMQGKAQPTYNDSFWYPRKGAQAIVDILAKEVRALGADITTCANVIKIDSANKLVYTNTDVYQYEYLINTAPLNHFMQVLDSRWEPLTPIFSHNKVLVFNLGFSRGVGMESQYCGVHWVYVPEKQYNFYRVGFYNHILREDKLSLYVEVGFDNLSPIDLEKELRCTLDGLKEIGIVSQSNELVDYEAIVMDPAYVHINAKTNEQIETLLNDLKRDNMYSIGRYGRWTYCSMEDCMLQAKNVAEHIRKG